MLVQHGSHCCRQRSRSDHRAGRRARRRMGGQVASGVAGCSCTGSHGSCACRRRTGGRSKEHDRTEERQEAHATDTALLHQVTTGLGESRGSLGSQATGSLFPTCSARCWPPLAVCGAWSLGVCLSVGAVCGTRQLLVLFTPDNRNTRERDELDGLLNHLCYAVHYITCGVSTARRAARYRASTADRLSPSPTCHLLTTVKFRCCKCYEHCRHEQRERPMPLCLCHLLQYLPLSPARRGTNKRGWCGGGETKEQSRTRRENWSIVRRRSSGAVSPESKLPSLLPPPSLSSSARRSRSNCRSPLNVDTA